MTIRRFTAAPEVGPFNALYIDLADDPDGKIVLFEDVAEMIAALRQCQSALAMMIAPDAIKSTTVLNAFAAATAAEAKARALIGAVG